MTKEKERELKDDIELFRREYSAKFRQGDKKYKGTKQDFANLTPKELLYEALAENLDQFSYLMKAIKKLK